MRVIDKPHKERYRYERSARVTVHVDPEVGKLWEEIAQAEGVRSTELLRRMIKQILAEYGAE